MTMNQSIGFRRLLVVLAASVAATAFAWLGTPGYGWWIAGWMLAGLGFVRAPGEHPVATTGASQTDIEIMLQDLERAMARPEQAD